jgi:hypothetical protein
MRFHDLGGEPVAVPRVLDVLARDGVVIFRDATRASLLAWFTRWAVVRSHPHADATGLTVITPTTRALAAPGTGGFGRETLPPHTDRSLDTAPPAVAAILVERPAPSGGESLLLDGSTLVARDPSLVVLRGAGGVSVPLTERRAELWRVRYRDDEVARPVDLGRPDGPPVRGKALWSGRPRVVRLTAGEGYVVHNLRYLHGRYAFHGDRCVIRVLGDVRDDSPYRWLNDGFRLPTRVPS